MVEIKRSGNFEKMLEALCISQREMLPLIQKRVKWFEKNPADTRLQNHTLKRRMEGKWAFSITSDIRIVYIWIDKHTARFLAIGPHKEVYTK